MIISFIQLRNIRCFEAFSTPLPAVGLLLGNHGVGKSSLLEAINYCLAESGLKHDDTMLRIADGVEEGEILLGLSDGSSVRCVVTRTGTDRMIKVPGATRWDRKRSVLDELVNSLSQEPLEFLKLKPRDQIDHLLKIAPIPVAHEELKAACGEIFAVPSPGANTNGLEVIQSAHSQIYALRTKVNSDKDALRNHAGEMEKTLPPAAEQGGWIEQAAVATRDIAALRKRDADLLATLTTKVQGVKDAQAAIRRSAEADIDTDINTRIAALEAERSTRKESAAKTESTAVEAEKVSANTEIKKLREEINPQIEALTANQATYTERAAAEERAIGLRTAIKDTREKSAKLEAESKQMTAALDRLNNLKTEVASRMKIKGITIAVPQPGMEPEICREENGALIPFSVWNSEAQDMLCFRLATMRHGKCGLITVDNIANFNKARQEAVIKTAQKYAAAEGLQFLLGKPDEPGMPLAVVDAAKEVV